MVALQIRDVPEDVRDVLAERARQAGQSLQGFLREVVLREALFARNAATVRDVAQWTAGTGVTSDDVLDALDAARDARPGAA
ncbi:MAG: hypothetical protein FWF02_12460 [Micrococcales bacterium]|nr:hypothetical protein [Micrococcales bacterium]MCL2668490.1 hypothetical protein [Micrococcales bacterium]